MPQPPKADSGLLCPLWRKDMSEVCHTCPWYIQMRGVNKNSGQDVDQWGCTISFLPMLLIENAAVENRTGAAVESFRNEMVSSNQRTAEALLMATHSRNLLRRDS